MTQQSLIHESRETLRDDWFWFDRFTDSSSMYWKYSHKVIYYICIYINFM